MTRVILTQSGLKNRQNVRYKRKCYTLNVSYSNIFLFKRNDYVQNWTQFLRIIQRAFREGRDILRGDLFVSNVTESRLGHRRVASDLSRHETGQVSERSSRLTPSIG